MSRSRQGTPLSWYSDSPVRNSVRVMVTSVNSIGSSPAVLSIVSDTSARPERGALRGAREDDVVHLAAAQRARALGAEHPCHRVDEVRLPRPVRARRPRSRPGSNSRTVLSAKDLKPRSVNDFRNKSGLLRRRGGVSAGSCEGVPRAADSIPRGPRVRFPER